jgi:imidazolonepropionase-like amidohydrolase
MNGDTTIFTGARVITGDGTTIIDDAALVVEGGVITRITSADQTGRAPRHGHDQKVLSCSGKTIMPAIVNPHGHIGYMRGTTSDARFYSRENVLDHLRRFAYHGVSTFQSLGTERDDLETTVRDQQRAGKLADPDMATLLTAGSGLVAPTRGSANGGPFFAAEAVHETSSVADAREFVRKLAAKRVDAVKFWVDDRGGTKAKLTPEISAAIVEEAHANGLKAAAHIYTVDDAKAAVRAGADILAHLPRDPEPDAELIRLLLAHDVAVFTSLSIQRPGPWDWLDDPMVRESVPGHALSDLRTQIAARAPEPLFDTGETFQRMERTFAILYQAGVRLEFSADTGLLAQLPGIAEHRELEALVHAGLSPLAAIELATRRSSRLLGLTDRGTLAVGQRADLIVLDGNPIDDITNTRRISAVYLNGRPVDRERLRAIWQQESAGRTDADASIKQ